ncbi:MAG TPA: four helix bundle protein [Candidatus Eisenbacteria bacterium]|nr:four helix bundle protein [Candidatus Eisenbacteria bacterium]
MTYIKSYKELIVWQKGIDLVKEIYILTSKFPREEIYGLTSQMRRAAISIPSNIAEGSGRKSLKDYAQFYSIAYGSALELETQVIIAKELKFAQMKDYIKVDAVLQEVARMLNFMKTKMRENGS